MFIRPVVARNTTALTATYNCAPENPYCLSTQRVSNNDTSYSATDATSAATPLLSHRNLVGVLVIAALLALGLILWLCFGKWTKPIRRLLRGEQRHSIDRFGIGDGLTTAQIDCHRHSTGASTTIAASKQSKAPPGPRSENAADLDGEEVEIVDSSSCSTESSLDQEGIKIDKDKEETKAKANLELEPALPAKVLHAFTIKSGSQLARLGR